MKIFWLICLIILILLLIAIGLYLLIGCFTYHISLSRKGKIKKTIEKNYANFLQTHNIDESYFKEGFEKLSIISEDNLKLYGYFKNNETNRLVVLVHGYGGNHRETANYAKIFDKRGYDILAVDLRSHGESEGDDLTMGLKESGDLILWLNKMIEINRQYKIVLFGVSMGASTICIACGENLPQNVVLAIEDCGYDNANKQFSYVYFKSKFHSKLIYKIFYNFTKKAKGLDLLKVDAVSKLKKSKIPIMFIHGGEDKFVPTEMVFNLSAQIPDHRRHVYIAQNAGHVASYEENSKQYESEINNFLSKYYM